MAAKQQSHFSASATNEILTAAQNDEATANQNFKEYIDKYISQRPEILKLFLVDHKGEFLKLAQPEELLKDKIAVLVKSRELTLMRIKESDAWALAFPVFDHETYRGSLIAIMQLADLNEDLNMLKYTVIIAGSTAWVILIAALFLSLNHLVIRRIKKLSQTSALLAGGNYSIRAKDGANDEIGVMAEGFNHMATSLITAINLQEQEKNKLQAIMDAQSEYLLAVDANCRITLANQRLINLLSLPPEKIIGLNCTSLINSDDCRKICRLQGVGTEEAIRDVEDILDLPNGLTIPIRKNVQFLRDENRNIVGAVETFRDISHEKELAKLKNEWESFIRHEIKSPLNPILGFSQLLIEKGPFLDDQTRSEYLSIIRESAQTLNLVLDMTREVQKYEMGKIELWTIEMELTITLEASINEARNALKGECPDKELISELSISPEINSTVPHDPEKMQRVFKNLIKNAWEHHDGPINIKMYNQDRFICVSIHNYGAPIPPERLKTIFEKYNTTKHGRGGTGLGTTIALLFTKANGGDIQVNSSGKDGTDFIVRLPRYYIKKCLK
ncbi:MAG: PAS domain-containing protein [Deltaproteobacteria bacterium]|nr:PAS domain-containing protein [Deltaproteobacteria bacterium]